MRLNASLLCFALVGCGGAAATLDMASDDAAMANADLGMNAPADLSGVPDVCNATDPRAQAPVVVATPEASEAPYIEALGRATTSIYVEVYLMGAGGILDALKNKAGAGVDVRVILDEGKKSTNQKYFDQLVAAGAQVKWSDPVFEYMHAKFILIDGQEVVISTGNFSRQYSIDLERNFVIDDVDAADVADLVELFDADWTRRSPMLSCTRLVVSPINAKERILALINGATSTLVIESMQFAETDVRAAVAQRVQAGVQVRALLADAGWIDANADAATFLKNYGVPVKSIPHLHTKVIIADGARAYAGSENLSWTSLTKNREVGLILTESSSVAPLVSTFESDWNIGVDF